MKRPDAVINVRDLEWTEQDRPDRFCHRRKALGAAAGGRDLGCSLYELPPGAASFPHHYHCGNEEALYVLEGRGVVRLGEDRFEVGAGDYVAFHTGPEGAHQVLNESDSPLRYLCLSTMIDPEVVVYPDSDKIGALAGAPPGGDSSKRLVSAFLPADAAVDYFDGES